MRENDEIDETTLKFLTNKDTKIKIPKVYFLPKIHKLDSNTLERCMKNTHTMEKIIVPGRPIVAQCAGPLEKIGKFLDFFLLPIVRKQNTYLSDTGEFIRQIENTKVDNNDILVTYDITSLYTNLKFSEILESVRLAIENDDTEYEIVKPKIESILEIINLVVSNNKFECNGKYYKQIVGISMGLNCSPELSDIAIYGHIENILENFPYRNKIKFHKRMRDDGCIIYSGPYTEIENLFRIANESHDLLKFTHEADKNCIKFLDTEIYKGTRFQEENVLDIRCHTKRHEQFQYLHRKSKHPPSCFKSFIKGEGLRILRNTSEKKEFKTRLKVFVEKLVKRGYNENSVWNILNSIRHEDRQKRLVNKCKKNKAKFCNLMMITTYHRKAEILQRLITKFWYIVRKDDFAKDIFKIKPKVAFTKSKSMGNMIINH